jgi:hypothetical protein
MEKVTRSKLLELVVPLLCNDREKENAMLDNGR